MKTVTVLSVALVPASLALAIAFGSVELSAAQLADALLGRGDEIAREFGVDHLLATELEVRDGRFTGRPSGTPCFRQGKVTCLAEWLGERGQTLASFPASWFYGDSLNDLPLLERVTHPVAVDPDETLRREALARGWRIISLE